MIRTRLCADRTAFEGQIMESLIRFVLSNFTLTLLILGLAAAGLALAFGPRPLTRQRVTEAIFAWSLLFSVGVSFLYNFVMHVFLSETAAAFIGWQPSPFQKEVGFASLGFSVLGFLAFRGGFEMRLAAVAAITCFLWGAAAGHVAQMVQAHNFAPGNAGPIFYTDILLPLGGLVLLALQRREAQADGRLATIRPATSA